MNESHDNALLSAYLDGELTAGEQQQVEAWLASDQQAQRLLDELRVLRSMLQAMPQQRIGRDLSEIILRRAEREMLAGNGEAASATLAAGTEPTLAATSSDSSASATDKIDDAKESNSSERSSSAWQWKPSPRGIAWAAAAIAAALLIMAFSDDPDERDLANADRTDSHTAGSDLEIAADAPQSDPSLPSNKEAAPLEALASDDDNDASKDSARQLVLPGGSEAAKQKQIASSNFKRRMSNRADDDLNRRATNGIGDRTESDIAGAVAEEMVAKNEGGGNVTAGETELQAAPSPSSIASKTNGETDAPIATSPSHALGLEDKMLIVSVNVASPEVIDRQFADLLLDNNILLDKREETLSRDKSKGLEGEKHEFVYVVADQQQIRQTLAAIHDNPSQYVSVTMTVTDDRQRWYFGRPEEERETAEVALFSGVAEAFQKSSDRDGALQSPALKQSEERLAMANEASKPENRSLERADEVEAGEKLDRDDRQGQAGQDFAGKAPKAASIPPPASPKAGPLPRTNSAANSQTAAPAADAAKRGQQRQASAIAAADDEPAQQSVGKPQQQSQRYGRARKLASLDAIEDRKFRKAQASEQPSLAPSGREREESDDIADTQVADPKAPVGSRSQREAKNSKKAVNGPARAESSRRSRVTADLEGSVEQPLRVLFVFNVAEHAATTGSGIDAAASEAETKPAADTAPEPADSQQ